LDIDKWHEWKDGHPSEERVALDVSEHATVTTIFTGHDNGLGTDPPRVYETMILGGKYDGYLARYPTREAAAEGHKKAVELAEAAQRGKRGAGT